MILKCLFSPFILLYFVVQGVFSSEDEERLMVDVFRGYNSLIQPVRNASELPLVVRVGLQLVLLIDVNEKDQVMHTNVWLTLKWHDFQMQWNPINYGEIREIRVSPDKVWLPDIVLFNNADGNYEVSFMCNVVINHKGEMLWVPPAIYKSSCIIDVEFFPFDEQVCTLVFGSWTYNEKEVTLDRNADIVDVEEYLISSIWDLTEAPVTLVKNRSRIEFQVRIRRKTLFYTVFLIIPTVLMAFLSMAVFYLPTDSTEKITLTVSVLLSIVVFLLLVSKILPPTSSTIPLMAKYLLLTFVLNVITILVTVIVINVYFRGPRTHRMPIWVRIVFLKYLPKLVCMDRPKSMNGREKTVRNAIAQLPGVGAFALRQSAHHPLCPSSTHDDQRRIAKCHMSEYYPLSPPALRAIDAIEYITDQLRKEEVEKSIRDDWKYVATVIDRVLLYVFFGITVGGTLGILFSAPHVFDGVNQKEILEWMKVKHAKAVSKGSSEWV